MSGHSKWATIHRQKEITDAKRGQTWTKITNSILVAVRATGITDPEKNFKLRLAIDKAREANMPKENIARAIERASGVGSEGEQKWEEVTYEGFGPGGISLIIQAVTDNNKRTVQDVKNYLERGGGKLVGPGSVAFQFKQCGLIVLDKPVNSEEAILKIIDLGADDVEEVPEAIEVYTPPDKLEEFKNALSQAGFIVKSYELTMKPITPLVISDPETAKRVLSFMDGLEELNDVQKVFSNFEISDELANQPIS
jgi:YebC/PmpR family DNA-binding regulatory protein